MLFLYYTSREIQLLFTRERERERERVGGLGEGAIVGRREGDIVVHLILCFSQEVTSYSLHS